MNNKHLFFVYLLFISFHLTARHPFRLPNPTFPHVTAQWPDGSCASTLVNRYIRYYPVFSFHTHHVQQYLLPPTAITFRDDATRSVLGSTLSLLIEQGVQEVLVKKKKLRKDKVLTHFTVLQDKNFNYKKSCGLLVLAFKEYPFVVKLFMEKPNTILNFHATGVEPTFFFYMGGGSNRHLSGLTRLANRELIVSRIAQFKEWADHIEVPRKWFWLPQEQKNIVLTGNNIGGIAHIQTEIPSIYAIVADKIDFSHQTDLISSRKKGEIIMQLCNDLELTIDPHAKNFSFIEDAQRNKFKIIIVDTEHFPTMVGIPPKKQFKSHNEWYIFLSAKCFSDIYLTHKSKIFRAAQASLTYHPFGPYLYYPKKILS